MIHLWIQYNSYSSHSIFCYYYSRNLLHYPLSMLLLLFKQSTNTITCVLVPQLFQKFLFFFFSISHLKDVDRHGIYGVIERALQYVDPENNKSYHVSYDIDSLDGLEAPSTGTRGLIAMFQLINFYRINLIFQYVVDWPYGRVYAFWKKSTTPGDWQLSIWSKWTQLLEVKMTWLKQSMLPYKYWRPPVVQLEKVLCRMTLPFRNRVQIELWLFNKWDA